MPEAVNSQSFDKVSVRFARWVFLLAGVGSLLEIVPLHFLEEIIGPRRLPITYPDFHISGNRYGIAN